MKIAVALALAGALGCAGGHDAGEHQSGQSAAGQGAGQEPQGPGSAGNPGTPQPPAPAALAHWTLEAPGIRGDFQSPEQGDIWAGSYHRVDGAWIRPFDVSGNLVWIASPTEVWSLVSKTSLFQVSTPSGQTAIDLSKPGRVFTAVGDGWIAFADSQPLKPTCCNGRVGLMRPSGGGFTEVSLPDALGTVTDVYADTALTEYGELFSWNGSSWERSGSVSRPAGPTAMFSWTRLSGSGSEDLFATAWLYASHLSGSAWSDFSLPGRVPQSIWARPYGPRWAIGGGAAGAEMFEWDGGAWEDRGEAPGNWNIGGPPVVGSDGTDVFVADYDGIYRYIR